MSRSAVRVLVLRHGQSTWNAEGRWQGQADPPLTPLGEQQAAGAGRALRSFGPPAVVVASDLVRAARTAEIIAAEIGHEPVVFDPRWRERHAGAWQGLTHHEVEAGWPGYLQLGQRPEGFEGSVPAGRRALDALADVATAAIEAGTGTHALVVSHGGILRSIRKLLGIVDDLGFPNLGGQWFDVDGPRVTPGDMVTPLDAIRPARLSPL